MKKLNRFKREKLIGYVVIGILILIFSLFIRKMEHVAYKVKLVNQGITFYENKKWLEAEETFRKAERYNWFEYKEEETSTYRQDLMWITNYYSLIQDIKEGISQVGDRDSFETFKSLVWQYEESGFEKLPDWQKAYLLEKCPIKEAVENKWVQYKAMIIQLLEEAGDEAQYSWAKKAVQDVPEKYFSSEKGSTVLNLIRSGDLKCFEEMRNMVGSYSEFSQFLNRMNGLYNANSACGYRSEWLITPVKAYIGEVLVAQAQGEIASFIHYVKACREEATHVFLPDNMEDFITNYVTGKERIAAQLTANKDYEAAVKLYTDMKYFKNYDKEIKAISKAQKYEDDEGFLSGKAEQYSLIQTGNGAFGGTKYIIGINSSSSDLELVSIKGNEDDYTATTYRMGLNQSKVTSVEVINGILLITGIGDTKAQHFNLVALQGEKLVMLFDLEAESLSIENGGEQLTVRSPKGKEEGKSYIYTYTETGYEEVAEKANEEENAEEDAEQSIEEGIETPGISDDGTSEIQDGQNVSPGNVDFSGLLGQTIIIECYVLDEQTSNLAVAICTMQGADGNGQPVYLYYENGSAVSSGVHKVKGVYVQDASYIDESGNEIFIPCIRIIEMDN